jgi:hypothetical protein
MTTGTDSAEEETLQVASLHGKALAGPSEAELVIDMCTAHWKQQGALEISSACPAVQCSSTLLLPAVALLSQ